jgi:hypothetical protein
MDSFAEPIDSLVYEWCPGQNRSFSLGAKVRSADGKAPMLNNRLELSAFLESGRNQSERAAREMSQVLRFKSFK